MAEKTNITKDTAPDVIEQDIAKTRKEMSKTIDQIEEKLTGEHWKAVLRETVREKVNSAASRGKELAGRAGQTARLLRRAAAGSSLKARAGVLQFMRDNPSAALLIAFELGVLTAITLEALAKRKARSRKESRRPEYATAKIMSIEEVEEKVKKAEMAPEEEYRKAA